MLCDNPLLPRSDTVTIRRRGLLVITCCCMGWLKRLPLGCLLLVTMMLLVDGYPVCVAGRRVMMACLSAVNYHRLSAAILMRGGSRDDNDEQPL